ncbi:MAG: ankyrin repeat domain-containing protein [Holophagaceae bacterium]|nr:ankyrin repeat domain-containing protein [Holophagaceae bacterium]
MKPRNVGLMLSLPALLAPSLSAQVLPKRPQILLDVDLMVAAKKNDIAALQRALVQGADPNAKGPTGATPLSLCALHGDGYRIAEQLIRAGANVNAEMMDGSQRHSMAALAAAALNAPLLRVLLKAGADPRWKDGAGLTLLHRAATGWEQGSEFGRPDPSNAQPLETVALLVKAGLEPDGVDSAVETPFSIALRRPFPDVALALLENGADFRRPTATKEAPIVTATLIGHPGLLRALLSKGADPKTLDPSGKGLLGLLGQRTMNGRSAVDAFHILVKAGLDPRSAPAGEITLVNRLLQSGLAVPALVHELAEAGAPVDSQDGQGLTPLGYAVQAHRLDLIPSLMEKGASATHGPHPPVVLAAFWGHGDVMRRFLAQGASPNTVDVDGMTPLLALTNHWDESLATLLLDLGADPTHVNHRGQTLFHLSNWLSTSPVGKRIQARFTSLDIEDKEGRTPLFNAVERNDYSYALWLLDHLADPNHRDHRGLMPLHQAARNNWHNTMIPLLLSKGAAVDPPKGEALPTALMVAALEGSEAPAMQLLDAGADPLRSDAEGNTALVRAAEKGNERLLMAMLARVADRSVPGLGKALLAAVAARQQACAKVLLDRGANPNEPGKGGLTPLIAAAESVTPSLIQMLLEQGAKVDARTLDGRTALMHLGQQNASDAKTILASAELLMKSGIDVKAVDLEGETALFNAYRLGASGALLVQSLEAAGLDPKTPNAKGKRPIPGDPFSVEANTPLLRALLDLGADPNKRAKCGHTLMLHALINRRWDQVPLLLSHGADLHGADSNQVEPIAYAAGQAPLETLQLFVRKGAHLSHRDGDGDTPLTEALIHGLQANAKYLLEAGAKPEDLFRGDWGAWTKLLRTDAAAAKALLKSHDDLEIPKNERGLIGIWTYGALGVAVLKDDATTLKRAHSAGLKFDVKPGTTPTLLDLAKFLGKHQAQTEIENALKGR